MEKKTISFPSLTAKGRRLKAARLKSIFVATVAIATVATMLSVLLSK